MYSVSGYQKKPRLIELAAHALVNRVNIGSDNDLLPVRRHAII